MQVHEIMTVAPMCCCRGEKAQQAANIMRQLNVGVIPIVESDDDETLIGLVTDRDLCLEVLADGTYPVEKNVEDFVDSEYHIQGIVSLADVAIMAHEHDVAETITEISEPFAC